MKVSLLDRFPEVAAEWHPVKNGNTTPNDVSPMSHYKAWWLGSCGHEWPADVSSRSKGHGCPYCNNLKALSGFNVNGKPSVPRIKAGRV